MNNIAQMYLVRFEDMRVEKELEIQTLALVLTEHCEGTDDSVDRAEVLQRQNHATQEIARYQNEITRIAEVITILKKGWDGTCTTCGEASVLPRLAIGVPTTRCIACQREEEVQIARIRAFPRGGMLHMPIARSR